MASVDWEPASEAWVGRLVRYWFGQGTPNPSKRKTYSEDVGVVVALEPAREPADGARLVVWWPELNGCSRHPSHQLMRLGEEA